MHKRDPIKQLVLRIIDSSESPLETKEIVDLAKKQDSTLTRTIVLKRLSDLRGDLALKGKYVGSGKGVWVWWSNKLFTQKSRYDLPNTHSIDKYKKQVLEYINSENQILETTEVVDNVNSTRTILLRRLSDLRGDFVIKGKQVGSGKGVWIWWRNEE